MQIRWARSARRHRISRARIAHVIEHCGLIFLERPPGAAPAGATERLVYLGDDADGVALEVMAVPLDDGILVIHAMPLRGRYRRSTRRRRDGAGTADHDAEERARRRSHR